MYSSEDFSGGRNPVRDSALSGGPQTAGSDIYGQVTPDDLRSLGVYDKQSKLVNLPEFLGGGSVNLGGPQEEKSYGGLPQMRGFERNHKVPYKAGGTNELYATDPATGKKTGNVEYDNLFNAQIKDAYYNQALYPALKRGDISLREFISLANAASPDYLPPVPGHDGKATQTSKGIVDKFKSVPSNERYNVNVPNISAGTVVKGSLNPFSENFEAPTVSELGAAAKKVSSYLWNSGPGRWLPAGGRKGQEEAQEFGQEVATEVANLGDPNSNLASFAKGAASGLSLGYIPSAPIEGADASSSFSQFLGNVGGNLAVQAGILKALGPVLGAAEGAVGKAAGLEKVYRADAAGADLLRAKPMFGKKGFLDMPKWLEGNDRLLKWAWQPTDASALASGLVGAIDESAFAGAQKGIRTMLSNLSLKTKGLHLFNNALGFTLLGQAMANPYADPEAAVHQLEHELGLSLAVTAIPGGVKSVKAIPAMGAMFMAEGIMTLMSGGGQKDAMVNGATMAILHGLGGADQGNASRALNAYHAKAIEVRAKWLPDRAPYVPKKGEVSAKTRADVESRLQADLWDINHRITFDRNLTDDEKRFEIMRQTLANRALLFDALPKADQALMLKEDAKGLYASAQAAGGPDAPWKKASSMESYVGAEVVAAHRPTAGEADVTFRPVGVEKGLSEKAVRDTRAGFDSGALADEAIAAGTTRLYATREWAGADGARKPIWKITAVDLRDPLEAHFYSVGVMPRELAGSLEKSFRQSGPGAVPLSGKFFKGAGETPFVDSQIGLKHADVDWAVANAKAYMDKMTERRDQYLMARAPKGYEPPAKAEAEAEAVAAEPAVVPDVAPPAGVVGAVKGTAEKLQSAVASRFGRAERKAQEAALPETPGKATPAPEAPAVKARSPIEEKMAIGKLNSREIDLMSRDDMQKLKDIYKYTQERLKSEPEGTKVWRDLAGQKERVGRVISKREGPLELSILKGDVQRNEPLPEFPKKPFTADMQAAVETRSDEPAALVIRETVQEKAVDRLLDRELGPVKGERKTPDQKLSERAEKVTEPDPSRDGEVVFDLETTGLIRKGPNGEEIPDITMVGMYDYGSGQYRTFTAEELPQFFELLKRSNKVVGFNIDDFDMRVLRHAAKKVGAELPPLEQVDMMKLATGPGESFPKLESLSQATLGRGKTSSGAEAVKMHEEGRIDELRGYVTEDVRLTKDLYEHGRQHGKLRRQPKLEGRPAYDVEVDFGGPAAGRKGRRKPALEQALAETYPSKEQRRANEIRAEKKALAEQAAKAPADDFAARQETVERQLALEKEEAAVMRPLTDAELKLEKKALKDEYEALKEDVAKSRRESAKAAARVVEVKSEAGSDRLPTRDEIIGRMETEMKGVVDMIDAENMTRKSRNAAVRDRVYSVQDAVLRQINMLTTKVTRAGLRSGSKKSFRDLYAEEKLGELPTNREIMDAADDFVRRAEGGVKFAETEGGGKKALRDFENNVYAKPWEELKAEGGDRSSHENEPMTREEVAAQRPHDSAPQEEWGAYDRFVERIGQGYISGTRKELSAYTNYYKGLIDDADLMARTRTEFRYDPDFSVEARRMHDVIGELEKAGAIQSRDAVNEKWAKRAARNEDGKLTETQAREKEREESQGRMLRADLMRWGVEPGEYLDSYQRLESLYREVTEDLTPRQRGELANALGVNEGVPHEAGGEVLTKNGWKRKADLKVGEKGIIHYADLPKGADGRYSFADLPFVKEAKERASLSEKVVDPATGKETTGRLMAIESRVRQYEEGISRLDDYLTVQRPRESGGVVQKMTDAEFEVLASGKTGRAAEQALRDVEAAIRRRAIPRLETLALAAQNGAVPGDVARTYRSVDRADVHAAAFTRELDLGGELRKAKGDRWMEEVFAPTHLPEKIRTLNAVEADVALRAMYDKDPVSQQVSLGRLRQLYSDSSLLNRYGGASEMELIHPERVVSESNADYGAGKSDLRGKGESSVSREKDVSEFAELSHKAFSAGALEEMAAEKLADGAPLVDRMLRDLAKRFAERKAAEPDAKWYQSFSARTEGHTYEPEIHGSREFANLIREVEADYDPVMRTGLHLARDAREAAGWRQYMATGDRSTASQYLLDAHDAARGVKAEEFVRGMNEKGLKLKPSASFEEAATKANRQELAKQYMMELRDWGIPTTAKVEKAANEFASDVFNATRLADPKMSAADLGARAHREPTIFDDGNLNPYTGKRYTPEELEFKRLSGSRGGEGKKAENAGETDYEEVKQDVDIDSASGSGEAAREATLSQAERLFEESYGGLQVEKRTGLEKRPVFVHDLRQGFLDPKFRKYFDRLSEQRKSEVLQEAGMAEMRDLERDIAAQYDDELAERIEAAVQRQGLTVQEELDLAFATKGLEYQKYERGGLEPVDPAAREAFWRKRRKSDMLAREASIEEHALAGRKELDPGAVKAAVEAETAAEAERRSEGLPARSERRVIADAVASVGAPVKAEAKARLDAYAKNLPHPLARTGTVDMPPKVREIVSRALGEAPAEPGDRVWGLAKGRDAVKAVAYTLKADEASGRIVKTRVKPGLPFQKDVPPELRPDTTPDRALTAEEKAVKLRQKPKSRGREINDLNELSPFIDMLEELKGADLTPAEEAEVRMRIAKIFADAPTNIGKFSAADRAAAEKGRKEAMAELRKLLDSLPQKRMAAKQ